MSALSNSALSNSALSNSAARKTRPAPTRAKGSPIFAFFVIMLSTASAVGVIAIIIGTTLQPESSFDAITSQEFLRRVSPLDLQIHKMNQQAKAEVAGQIHFMTNYIEDFSSRIDSRMAKNLAVDIFSEAYRVGADPFLVTSLIQSESAFRKSARSNKSAFGLMQIQPATGKFAAEITETTWKGQYSLMAEQRYNIRLGTAYLQYLQARFDNDLRKALMAYNWGPTNLDLALSGKKRIPAAVKHYADSIMKRQTQFHLTYRDAKSQYRYMNVNFIPETLWSNLIATS